MFSENIGNDYIVIQEGTSEGTQVKYKKDGYWYKKDNRGNEGRAENGGNRQLLYMAFGK